MEIGAGMQERKMGQSVAMIAAMDRNRAIGKNNRIPWRLPAEQNYFRKVTLGHTVLTGRLNFEAMGRPLPGRRNVVLTRSAGYAAEGCEVVHTVEEALEKYGGTRSSPLFVIGGEQIYRLFMPYADRLYLTYIDAEFDGDTFFPEFDAEDWEVVSREAGVVDDRNRYGTVYTVYRRRVQQS